MDAKQPKDAQTILTRRIHIFMDGFGWSSNREAQIEQLQHVTSVQEIPPIARDCLITTFNSKDAGDLEYLQDAIQELRTDATWARSQ